jgi:hypothetical protein
MTPFIEVLSFAKINFHVQTNVARYYSYSWIHSYHSTLNIQGEEIISQAKLHQFLIEVKSFYHIA